jgi:amino acid adenylation domain-containing protein
MTFDQLLSHLRQSKVDIWVEGDRLRYKGSHNVVNAELLEHLREHKQELMAFLGKADTLKESFFPEIHTDMRLTDNLPLSFAQEPLWFLQQLEPENVSDHLYMGFRLTGDLNVAALESCFNEIFKRHEILRTSFPEVDGKPVQIISPTIRFEVHNEDLRTLGDFKQNEEIQKQVNHTIKKPFDLAQGQLLRARLLWVKDDEHILILTMHHIISDGLSFDILFSELATLYEAFSSGKPSPLEVLPVQFADCALWQRQWLQGKLLEKQISYWKKKLSGSSGILELPTDKPRPAVQTHQGAKCFISFPKDLFDALKVLSQDAGCTLFMTLVAAFQTLLYRYTIQDDLIIGIPIANRKLPELEKLIGLFLNTVVLRTDLSGNPNFWELLKRVREVILEAIANQDLPFEKLVKELKPQRDPSRNPLFQVMFQYSPRGNLELPGLSIERLEFDSGSAQFDLSLHLYEEAERLRGFFEYNTDLFEASTIDRMAGHFLTLLEGIVEKPDCSLSDFTLLTTAEKHQLFSEWNDTAMDLPRDKCIHEVFENQVKQTPEAIAVVYQNKEITYGELNTRANKLAHFLKEQGVGSETVVALCVKRSIEMVVGILGILKAGGIYLPLDSAYPEERLHFMLEDSRARILLSDEKGGSFLSKCKAQVVYLDPDDGVFAHQSLADPVSEVKASAPAYLIYTSGSTGTPKGVIGLHRGALNRFNWMWKTYPFQAGEACCQKTSISFVDSIWEILGPLLQGIKSIIMPDEVVKDPKRFIEYLADEEITRILMVPSYLRVILDTHPDLQRRLPKLKTWISSGEILSKELCHQFYQRMPHSVLLNLYGSSEVSADVTWYDTGSMNSKHLSVPIGRPIANTQVYILDRYLQPLPIGVPGELHIGGEGLAAGYINLSQNTEDSFISNPFSDKADSRLYKTGDIGRWLPDGNIEYIGRVDHQVKIRGFRIELGEVEEVLNKHPDVGEGVVVVQEDRPNDKRLVAYVVLKQKRAKITHELYRFLKQSLPDYMLPAAFVFLNRLPLTPSGKIDRKSLPAPARVSSEPSEAFVPARDELEQELTKTWEKVLGVQPIGVTDNFFELGGHSLLAVRLFTQIEKILGKSLPLGTLFQAPTVEKLAGILRELGWSVPSSSLEEIGPDTASFSGIKSKFVKTIPEKSLPFFREQYLKVKKQSGYLYLQEQYLKVKKQSGYRYLKREYLKARHGITKRFFSYEPFQLEVKFREMGLRNGDTVYMHSAFGAFNGFSEGPQSVIDCVLNVIGDSGNLLMVSMPYTGCTADYLKAGKTFDVINTESSMGIITELFRRKKDVLRSLNPAHPILAFGPDAEWIISDHEKTMHSCGEGSPFEKILQLNAKAIFFDVPFGKMTFFHFLEDRFRDCSPIKLYDDEPLECTVIDSSGNEIGVKTYASSTEARVNRSVRTIKRELKKRNLMKTDKIGSTKLILVNLNDIVGCAQELVNAGMHFYVS